MNERQNRERVNLDALVRPPSITLPGGVVVHELSAGVVTLARKLDLRILTGDKEARAALSTDDVELELYAIGWLMCAAPAAAGSPRNARSVSGSG